MIILFRLILISVLLFLSIFAFAKKPEEGRSSIISVTSISQDPAGLIWFGTAKGLLRFDGRRLTQFRQTPPKSQSGLVNNWVSAIHHDQSGRLWIATTQGLQSFDASTEVFRRYPIDANVGATSEFNFTSMLSDTRQNIWLASSSGLYRFNTLTTQTKVLRHSENNKKSLSHDQVHAIDLTSSGHILVATEAGLDLIDSQTLDISHVSLEVDRDYTSAQTSLTGISQFAMDSKGIWAVMQNELIRLSHPRRSDGKTVAKLHNERIRLPETLRKLIATQVGDLWAVGRSGKLYRKRPSSQQFIRYDGPSSGANPHCGADVMTVFEDRTGVIWVGGWDLDYCFIVPDHSGFQRIVMKDQTAQSATPIGVISLATNAQDSIFALTKPGRIHAFMRGDSTGMIYRQKDEHGQFIMRWESYAQRLFVDRYNAIWGVSPDGIRQFDPKTGWFSTPRCRLDPKRIYRINDAILDRNDSLWISSENGVVQCDLKRDLVRYFQHSSLETNSLTVNFVYPLAVDLANRLWMGTRLGLQLWDQTTQKFSFFTFDENDPDSVPLGSINSLHVDRQGNLWIGSDSHLSVIQAWKNSKPIVKKYRTSSSVSAIREGENGQIWFSTDSGIARFDSSNERMMEYSALDGIAQGPYVDTVATKSASGILYFGSTTGMTFFDPSQIHLDFVQFRPLVTQFSFYASSEQSARQSREFRFIPSMKAQELTLPNDTYALRIEFVDTQFARSSVERVGYFMEGLDREWHVVSPSELVANYSNLNPGTYRFKISARNRLGEWSAAIESLVISIPPPFWKTTWMKVVLVTLTATILILVHRIRIRSLLKAKAKLEAEVALRTEVISKQNQDKSKFIADAAHDLRQPMQAIGNLLEAANHSLRAKEYSKGVGFIELAQKAVGIMRSAFHSVLELSRLETGMMTPRYESIEINHLIEYIVAPLDLIAQEAGVNISLRLTKERDVFVRSDKTFVSRMIHNLVGNAIKYHSPFRTVKKVIIHVVKKKHVVRIYVIDNGIGIPKKFHQQIFQAFFQINQQVNNRESGTGLGLSIVQAMVTALDGHKLNFRSRDQMGTAFYLDMPYAETIPLVDLPASSALANPNEDNDGIFILFIEDDSLVRQSIQAVLTSMGFVCVGYATYQEMVDGTPLIDRIPDLILTDFLLEEGHTSTDVIRFLRAQFDFAIPAIILTGESRDIESETQHLAQAILYKPVSVARLLQEINHLRGEMISRMEFPSS